MTNLEKTTLSTWICDGNIQKAIDKLLVIKRNESLDKEALVIASRYNRLKREERSGILTPGEFNIRENQIVSHLINIINHPEENPYPIEKSRDKPNIKKPAFRKYAIIMLTTISITFSLALAFDLILSNEPEHLVIFVQDTEGNPALELTGKINIPLGERPLSELIDEEGTVDFFGITPENIGDTIRVGLDAKGWEIVSKDTFVFDGEAITIVVKRDHSLGIIRGVVRSRDGQEFIEGAKVSVRDTFTYANKDGYFEIILPEEMRVKNEQGQYHLIVSKDGYKTEDYDYTPLSTDAQIRLKRKAPEKVAWREKSNVLKNKLKNVEDSWDSGEIDVVRYINLKSSIQADINDLGKQY